MKKLIPTIAALLMMFVFGYVCPTWSTVTPVGLKVLGAFIGWLILVIAGKGMVIASCLAFFAFALSGSQTPAELLAAGFGSTGLLQFLYAFLLTGAFTRSGAGEGIVRWALSRKALNGRPMLFRLVWWTAMTILGALTTNVVACMMLGFSLIASIAKVARSNEAGYCGESSKHIPLPYPFPAETTNSILEFFITVYRSSE